MKKDFRYIIKRILVGVGIALALMFIKQNVYASEVNDLLSGNNTTLLDYTTLGDVYVSEFYVNYYQSQYVVPVYNESTHTPTTPNTSGNNCQGYSFKHYYYANIGSNDPYNMPSYPSTSVLGTNYGGCSTSSTKYMTLGGIVVDFSNFTFEKDKYYKINLYYLNEYDNSSRDLTINNAINDPEDLKVKLPSSLEVYSMQYMTIDYEQGPFVQVQDTTSSYYNWLLISIILKVNENTTNPILYFGYNPTSTLISGTSTYPTTFTSNDHLPLLMFNYNKGTSSWANAMNLNGTRPFVYEYVVENPSIQVPEIYNDVQSDIEGIIGDINNGSYDVVHNFDDIFGGGNGGLHFGDYSFSELLTFPVRFLQTLSTTTTCEPITMNLPIGNNSSMTIPCFSTFFENLFGHGIYSLVQTLIMGSIILYLIFDFYDFILHIADPSGLLFYEDIVVNHKTGEVKKIRRVK